jgi:hypothetical protein
MLLVGYVFAIRSERRICAEIQVNLGYDLRKQRETLRFDEPHLLRLHLFRLAI